MSGSSSGVTFLSLAYLIEIGVVMNLAYRELKFPDLDNKVHEKVNDYLSKANQMEIPKVSPTSLITYKEYNELKSLIEKNGENDSELWGEHLRIRRWFYNKFIRNRRSLKIVNANILVTIAILIGCTFATGKYAPIENVFFLDSEPKVVWFILFLVLTVMTVLPLWFVRMATLCEKHLLGVAPQTGLVQKLGKRMIEKRERELAELKTSATGFKVP